MKILPKNQKLKTKNYLRGDNVSLPDQFNYIK